ncbi:MAG: class I SAM-dependent methyltransferase, partial [Erysipelotrichaceae bacterium]|nr:class I SAM-dependent methyltransferase [Erysipelotrichaceae bacterium]
MPRSESEFREKALEEGVPIIQETGLSFLLGLIHRYEIKEILELGTAVAYSSIQMALSFEEVMIDTVEKEDDMVREALRNIEEAGLSDRIRVHHCPAEEFYTEKTYDLIFVDAAKAQYAHYLERFLPNLKEDG